MPYYKLKTKKGGKQGYRVVVNYTDKNGKKQKETKCVYGLKEAQETEAEIKKRVKNEGSPSAVTIKQLYDIYIKDKEHKVRRSSLEKTKSILANHVLNTSLASVKLDKLSRTVLQEWKSTIADKKIMVSTKNNAYRELNAMLNFAVNKTDHLDKNPLKSIG